MCDQTEVIYAPGDVVWVKLGPVWWPSQVQDYDKLPEDITANLRKRPIAVVKFFQEDAFEYVKNLDQIYHYNCRRKHEFIKKGIDMCRSSNRNVPSNMKMFPNDIATAEHLTNGDPNILSDPQFEPEEKKDYRELFGKKPAKKSKLDHSKEWRIRSFGESPLKSAARNGRQSLPTTPRPVTHPRFINKALGKGSDHEVRIRSQGNDLQSSGKLYNCHLCGFSASRINVIILHNKSHSAGYADAYLPSTPSSGSKGKKRSLKEKQPRTSLLVDRVRNDEPPVKRKTLGGSADNKSPAQSSGKSQKEGKDSNTASADATVKSVSSSSPVRKPIFGKKRTAKDKAEKAAKEKRQTDEFRENLLKDWDDDDEEENGDDAEDKDKDDNKTLGDKTFNSNSTDTSPAKDDTKKTPTKETSCFDFDDSEDGIKPEDTIIQFGRKIPRIFGDKKRKSDSDNLDDSETVVETKEEERDAVSEHTPMSELSNETESIEEKKAREEKEEKDKKAKEEFDMAFKALLEETVAPTIPDAFDSKRDEGECSVEENIVNSTSVVDEEIIPPDPHEEENQIKKSEEVVVDNLDASKCASVDENQHFLVKMSGEGATTSPDKEISESKSTICDASNVAHQLVENFEQGKETVSHVEEIVEQTTEIEEVVEFKVDETVEKAEANCTNSQLPKEEPADSSKCQAFLSNDFVDDCIVDNYCSIEQTVPVQQSPLKSSRTSKSKSESMLIETAEKPKKISNESKGAGLVQASDMQFIVVANEASNVVTTMSNIVSSSTTSVNNPYQDMDFDIDSMPVIIGDDMTQGEQLQESQVAPVLQTVETTVAPQVQQSPKRPPMIASKSPIKQVENKVVTVISSTGQISKMNRNELKQVHKIPANKKDPPIQQIKVPTTKDTKITKKILLSPTKPFNSPAAVKISTSSSSQMGKLSVPSFVTQKGIVQNAAGSGPVLILQSAGPSGSASKSTIQKMPQVIQQAGGNKVLILTSPSGASGQKMLGTLTSPQKSITGTRFLTTKGSVVVGKGGKPCQKIVIDKTGAISQSSKSVIIDKASISAGSTLSKSSTAILTSSNDSIASLGSKFTLAGNSKGTTILASPTVSGNKGVILTPLSNKSTAVADNQKLRLIASKSNSPVSSATKTKVVLKTQPQARLLVPSVAMKNQQLKFMTNAAKTQPNSSSTILIHTNQGVLATSSFPGAIQKQTTTSKPQATLIATPKAHILQANNKAMLQLQNKKVIIPKKPASPNILQKSQRKPVQRVSKKNFLTEQASAASSQVIATPPAVTCAATAPTQDVLLLPSMKNMPVVSQGTILQGTTVDAEGRKSYVYLTVDEHGNYRPLETAPVLDFDMTSTSEQQIQQAPTSSETQLSTASTQPPPQQTLYFDPGATDLDNLLLAIDEAGNVVNISQQQAPVPQSSTVTSGSSSILGGHSGQDILAKALADTQVLQQEPTIIPDPATSSMLGCVFVESMPPTSSVAHNVLETSSTLNQTPIMTPLEVPSAVSSLQTLPPDFLKRDTVVDPSMPLLSEDSTVDSSSSNTKTNKTIFVSGDSSSMLGQSPTTSLAFQLSIGADNNIIVSSSAAGNIGTSLAYMTQPSTSVTDTILSQTSNNIEYVHSEDVNAAGDGILDQTVEQQVVTDSAEVYPITASGVTFDMDDVHKKVTYTEECETMNSAAAAIPVSMSIDYQETGSAHVMGTKTDYGGVPFNVEETTMSVASGDYDLNISDSTKTLTPSVEAASDQQMTTVEKLSLDADKQR